MNTGGGEVRRRPPSFRFPPPVMPPAAEMRRRWVSAATALRVAWLFGPLLATVVVLRLLELAWRQNGGAPPPLGPALLPAALALAGMAGHALLWWRRGRRWPPWMHGLAGTALVGVVLGAGAAAAPASWASGLTWTALGAVRSDLLLLAAACGMAVLALEHARGRLHGVVVAVLHLAVPFLLLLRGVAFGYFAATGTTATGPLLAHFALHVGDLASVVASEVHGPMLLLLALLVGASLTPWLVLRLPSVRRRLAAGAAERPVPPGAVAAAVLPGLLLLALLPGGRPPPGLAASSYVGLAESLVGRVAALPAARAARPAPAPFDAEHLRLTATDAARPWNVVVVVLESARARSTTPYAPALGTTPFLDSLARHGQVVEDFFVTTPYTNKALVSLLAGIYPYPHRTLRAAEPGGLPAPGLPTLLRPHGYRSAFFTSADLGFERQDRLLRNLGFDHAAGAADFAASGYDRANYLGRDDRVVIEPSLRWAEARADEGAPFFLTYLTVVSHHPYTIPGRADDDAPAEARYLETLRYTDDVLRALFDGFRARGLMDSTLFVVTADHGEAFGEHVQRLHGAVLYDEVLHVPAILFAPGLDLPPGRIRGPRQQIDLVPTVADALGLRLTGGTLPGRSLLRPVPADRVLVHSAWDSDFAMALRRGTHKVIDHGRRRPMEAFDLDADPYERRDVAARLPPTARHALRDTLLQWQRSVERAYE